MLSSATDPYQPAEADFFLTRRVLEAILRWRFPVHVMTKSELILRDVDILKKIDRKALLPRDLKGRLKRGVVVSVSFSTADDSLGRIFEPGAPSPSRRFRLIERLSREGFFVGACFIPVLPFLEDRRERLRKMVKLAVDSGAKFVFVGALTLPSEGLRNRFLKVLKKVDPEAASRCRDLFAPSGYPQKGYSAKLGRMASEVCKERDIHLGVL